MDRGGHKILNKFNLMPFGNKLFFTRFPFNSNINLD